MYISYQPEVIKIHFRYSPQRKLYIIYTTGYNSLLAGHRICFDERLQGYLGLVLLLS